MKALQNIFKQYGSKKNEDVVLPDLNVGDALENTG